MRKSKRNKIIALIALIVAVGLGIWISIRWEAWFYNPDEEPYTVSTSPQRLLLTFGNDGEMSRYVSWMCDTIVHEDASLLLANNDDTLNIKAIGEVFVSRAGKAAYYRAEMKNLKPNAEYHYAVETNGKTSAWHQFRTYNPKSDSFAFLFMGDVQDTIGGVANRLLRNAVESHPEVEFVAFGGDLTERPTDRFWAETFRSIDSVCTAMPVVNITGNHDYLKYLIRKCERRFALVFPYYLKGMTERDDENHLFTLHYHNTDIFMLDSDRGIPSLYKQSCWLEDEMKKSNARNQIVMTHHPLYSVKRPNNNLTQRWMFNDIIVENGAELVLQGHEHAYTRCANSDEPMEGNSCKITDKPLYTVSHCSPKNYKIHPHKRFKPVLSGSRYYQVIKVSKNGITMLAFDANTNERVDSADVFSK